MKLTAMILLVACMQVSANGFSQITLSETNTSLQKVFKKIERQTGYDFLYPVKLLENAGTVTVEFRNASVSEAMQLILAGKDLDFTISDKLIVIKKKTEIPLPPVIDVHGRIINEKGEPVDGVSVKVRGTNTGTTTNANGEFNLKGVDENATLIFSATNIEGFELKINGRTDLNTLIAKTKISPMDEVQVQAYGTVSKRYNVGSISTVKAEDIAKQPVANPLQSLQGRVPGLVVTSTSGLPGSAVNVQIRGQNSLTNDPTRIVLPLDQPLFIIDGVPLTSQNMPINQLQSIQAPPENTGVYNNYGGISPFNLINPADINTIEILRDADATAIYGSRGSNGVIIITTKKGKAGKTKLSGNVWTGESRVTRTMPMMNTEQYLAMRHEAILNDGYQALLDNPSYAKSFPDIKIYDTTSYTDWKKYFLGSSAHTIDANASISGGTVNTQFLIGAGFHRETYIFPGDFSDKRVSFNGNVHHSSADQRLNIDLSFNYAYDNNNSSGNLKSLTAFTLSPDYPALFKSDGSLQWSYNGLSLANNPVAYLKQSYNIQNYNLVGHFQIEYQLLPGLTIRSSVGYNTLNSQEISKEPKSSQPPDRNPVANSSFGNNNFITWIVEPQVEYKTVLFKGRLNVLLGETFQQNANNGNTVSASGYNDDALLGSVSSAASTFSQDQHNLYKYFGAFGRINYIVDSKYIINLSGRRDGSSRFGPGRQFGNFGAAGVGWIFSEERGIKDNFSLLSFGKLHVSYGTTGSDGVGDYQYIANWSSTASVGGTYQGSAGYQPLNLTNPNFSWAVNKKLEAGIDLGFFHDRILVNATWYRNRCANQLVAYLLPSQTGFYNVTQNFPAVVQNSGLELQIASVNIKTRDFSWATSANLTVPKNKLVSFPGIENSSYATTYIVGQPLSLIQGYQLLGVNDTTGLFQFLTKTGPTYSPVPFQDYHIIGKSDPDFYGGFKNTFSYKGFQLDVFVEFKKQLGSNSLQKVYGSTVGGSVNLPEILQSRWQKPGDHSDIQKLTMGGVSSVKFAGFNFQNSDGAYSDASYIRLKTIAFSYAFNAELIKKMKISGLRLYCNAQNLLTITHYKGNDPETQNFYGVPPLKTIVMGLQLEF